MVLTTDQERVKTLIKDTITLLCKNGLTFRNKFNIEAVIGVTLDDEDVFLVSINEIIKSELSQARPDSAVMSDDNDAQKGSVRKRRHKHKRHRIQREVSLETNRSDDNNSPAEHYDISQSADVCDDDEAPPVKKQAFGDGHGSGLKQEVLPEPDDDDDVTFIKQELDDTWSSCAINKNDGNSTFINVSGENNYTNQTYTSSAADINLLRVGHEQSGTSWSQRGAAQSGRYNTTASASTSVLPGDEQDQQGEYLWDNFADTGRSYKYPLETEVLQEPIGVYRYPWPAVFPMNQSMFHRSLWDKLQNQQKLDKKEKGQLLDGIYEECMKYQTYLDPSQYSQVTVRLLEGFPYLSYGLSRTDALEKWKRDLRTKFKNTRQRRDKHMPEVQMRKKRKLDASKNIPGKAGTVGNLWNIPNFLPERPDAEDDVQHNLEVIKDQSRLPLVEQQNELITEALAATFSVRRSSIVVDEADLVSLKRQYPLLFQAEQILQEFERLTNYDLSQIFDRGLSMYADKIVRLPSLKTEPENIKTLRLAVSNAETQKERTYAVHCAALLLIPLHLREKIDTVMPSEVVANSSHPIIKVDEGSLLDGSFTILAEGVDLAKTKCLIEAFKCLCASYYVFNFVFPKDSLSTYRFLQRALIGQTSAKIDSKVVTLLTKLNTL